MPLFHKYISHLIHILQNGLHGQRDMLEVPRDIVENGDEEDITEIEAALLAAEENCSGDTCILPATQHIQIRVIHSVTHFFLFIHSG